MRFDLRAALRRIGFAALCILTFPLFFVGSSIALFEFLTIGRSWIGLPLMRSFTICLRKTISSVSRG